MQHGDIDVRLEKVTSNGFTVRWPPVEGADTYEVQISAEPPGDDGTFHIAQSLGKVTSKVTELKIDRLVPNVHTFVQVKVVAPSTDFKWGAAHVLLDEPKKVPATGGLVSAYAMAPNLLAIVIRQQDLEFSSSQLQGNHGTHWQSGTWEVLRENGDAIPVRRVARHSVVAGQGRLAVGFDRHGAATVHVEHRLYLELEQPIGQQAILRVRHTGEPGTELDAILPFSDRYLETPVIQVNQVGYNPLAKRRWAYVYGWLGDGGPLGLEHFPKQALALIEPTYPLAPRRAALRLSLAARPGRNDDVQGTVRQIDLARLPPAEGVRYRIQVPGVGVSYPTAVNQQASFKAFYTVMRGLYHNRWCGDLRPELTAWNRPADHCSAYFVGGRTQGFFPKDTEKANERPVRGGHHDAGDFDIRPLHVLVGQSLLRAFELGGQARFGDGQLNIPESGNGIPDVLDEALWSLAAWEDLQEPDGSVRLGVESTRHPPGYYLAHQDELPYFAYGATPAHSAYVAGLFAQASFLVRPFDDERSQRLISASLKAVEYAKQHKAPETYLAYAFGELARAGVAEAAQHFENAWRSVNVHGRGLFDHAQPAVKIYPGSIYSQHPAMADFVVAYLDSNDASPSVRRIAMGKLRDWAETGSRRLIESPQPHRSARPPGARPDWGMETVQGRYLDGIYQLLHLGELPGPKKQAYFDALSLAADAMLGCNPAGASYITGLGTRSPKQPLHLDSIAFQTLRGLPPVPGLVVYGPVESMPGSHYYQPLAAAFYPPFEEHPRALRHVDAVHAVNMSEFSVWESQAPTALLFAALLPEGLQPWPALSVGQPEHKSPLPPHTKPGSARPLDSEGP